MYKTILTDIDGVIADPRPQVEKYLHNGNWNWDEYFKHTLELEPIPLIVEMLDAMALIGNRIIFITGRPQSNRRLTTQWLMEHFRYATVTGSGLSLLMRSGTDTGPTTAIKLKCCDILKPDLVLEDEPDAVSALVTAGYKVLQVHGYRISGKDGIPGIAGNLP